MVGCENPAHANTSANTIRNCRMWHKLVTKKRAPKNSGGWTSGARKGPPPQASGNNNRKGTRKPNNTSNNGNCNGGGQQSNRTNSYKSYKMLALELEVEKAKTENASYANLVKRKLPAQQQQQQQPPR
jgi:hypothetical protein